MCFCHAGIKEVVLSSSLPFRRQSRKGGAAPSVTAVSLWDEHEAPAASFSARGVGTQGPTLELHRCSRTRRANRSHQQRAIGGPHEQVAGRRAKEGRPVGAST